MSNSFSSHKNPETLPDQELYKGLLNNHRPSISQLYREVYPMAKAQLMRMGANEEEVKDAFQEGMVALWKNTQQGKFQLQAETKMSTYLIQICKNQFLEKKRKLPNTGSLHPDQQVERLAEDNFLDHWFKKEEMEKLSKHLRMLGERCQKLLKLFYYERESMREIALEMNLGEASAKNEKYRCMQKLKKTYDLG